jgi:DNA-binding response OmpR family regulator
MTTDKQRPQILVVEDESMIAELLIDALTDAGFRIIGPASRVKDALELIEKEPPDLALLDVTLGRERSYPVARELAERGIPFLFMTGHADRDLLEEFRDRPVLTKPMKLADLATKVRVLLA